MVCMICESLASSLRMRQSMSSFWAAAGTAMLAMTRKRMNFRIRASRLKEDENKILQRKRFLRQGQAMWAGNDYMPVAEAQPPLAHSRMVATIDVEESLLRSPRECVVRAVESSATRKLSSKSRFSFVLTRWVAQSGG